MFTDYYLPTLGGVQTSIKAQKEALEKAGHRVTIFCPLHAESQDPSIIRLPTSAHFKPDNFPFAWPPGRVIAVAKEELSRLGDIDIIHSHSEMAAMFAGLIAGRELNIPTVQTMHGRHDTYARYVLPAPSMTTFILARIHRHYIKHPRNKRAQYMRTRYTRTALARRMWRLMVDQANYVDHVIVPSHHFAKKLQDQGVTKPLAVLSNGLEESVLQSLTMSKPRKYTSEEKLKIMWCGRMSPEKRPLEFLKAIRQLSNVEVGMYGDSIAMNSVKRYIRRYSLHDVVTLHGSVPQKAVLEAMKTHHVFVSSSYDFDNQPMVLLEAVATGLPVVYCDPDLGEVIPAKGSIVTESPDAAGIVKAFKHLQANPTLVGRMSKAMLAARVNTAQVSHFDQLVDIYTSILRK
jgi:glycosyltransferase involved in cell wall biosynthesis